METRRLRLLWPALLALLLTATAALAAPPPPEAVSNPAITAPEILAHIRYLASDELQGRGSGTPGNNLAGDYIASRFRACGLTPAGENGTYFQKFSVFTGVKLGDGNRLVLAEHGATSSPKISAGFMPLSFSKNGSVNAPLVFAGYGISEPSLGYDDYKGLDVRGKVVVVLRHTPDGDDSGKFGPYALLTYKTMTARDKGAAGILLLTGPLTSQPEDLGKFQLDSASADCGIPAAFVKREFVEKLLAPSGKNLRDLQVTMAHGSPKSFALPGARAELRVNILRQMASTRNVLGLLEGSDPALKDQVIVVGAHYDHLGLGDSHSLAQSDKPQVHHGADDNASGTAGVMELAQYFAAHREKLGRSVLFMCFSGEEMGLLGSAHWVKQPTIPLSRVAAMVNMDMVGRLRNDTLDVIGAGSSPGWKSLLESANGSYHFTLKTGGASGFGGSDQQSFYAKSIPVLFFFTGIHPDYHRPSDTWAKINAEGEQKVLELVADVVERMSRLADRPQFTRASDVEPSTSPGFRVYLGTIPDYAAEVEGVALEGVREKSPAEAAGIRAGDVIVEFDGKKIRNVEEYAAVLGTARAGVPVKIVVMRAGTRVTVTVTPRERRE